ncbi:hypothetical protein G6F61_002261 [Rhizopus arrhizus]|nr:hypothetical protein G6F66_008061 [Rhizopus arrhizus]KAG1382425.1 hypothetical protein G6F61_002261 [Rhizopus arrhizus]
MASNELDFHLPSRTPLHGLTVAEWAGTKAKHNNAATISTTSAITAAAATTTAITTAIEDSKSTQTATPPPYNNNTNIKPNTILKDTNDDNNWKDVYRNIKCMDQLYDASFYSWLKSEENVLVTAMYLHRIANEYPLVRIINALKWLISDWRLESISDLRRAHLLRHLTNSWATQYTTTLITMVLSSAPYASTTPVQRERFLRAFTKDWNFSKLSEFFMYLTSPANIDYKVKCVMLQEAARKETLSAKLIKKKQEQERHHRRTSSNDVNDIKRLRLSTPDLDHVEQELICSGNGSSSSTTDACNHSRSVTSPSSNSNITGSSGNNISSSSGSSSGGSSSSSSSSCSSSSSMSGSNSTSNLTTSSNSTDHNHEQQRDAFIYPSLHGLSHLRRRSSSIGSTDSCDMIEDPMDTTETTAKKKNGASSNHVFY